jgi:hypothetical protein
MSEFICQALVLSIFKVLNWIVEIKIGCARHGIGAWSTLAKCCQCCEVLRKNF